MWNRLGGAFRGADRLTKRSTEGRNPGDRLAENQRVDVVRPLVGVHRLDVGHVTHRLILDQNTVGAEQPFATVSKNDAPEITSIRFVASEAAIVRDLLRRHFKLED